MFLLVRGLFFVNGSGYAASAMLPQALDERSF
jgi:hypothetical protein